MTGDGIRLIEDYLPVEAISRVSASEKVGGRLGHPSTLHLWWARRPLAAARAAVYAALVPAEGRDRTPGRGSRLFHGALQMGSQPPDYRQGSRRSLEPRMRCPSQGVDLFAGGGAIPLEAARLGCDATAIELNPVAHLIERCMLEYPQTFPGLADDVRNWGKVWVDRAWEQLKDLYPPVPGTGDGQQRLGASERTGRQPLAYLWTRTVRCPNPALPDHLVPLVRQTWLAHKKGRCIALRTVVDKRNLTVTYEVVEATTPTGLGFDPAAGSKHGRVNLPHM